MKKEIEILSTRPLDFELVNSAKANDIAITSIEFIKTIPLESNLITEEIDKFSKLNIAVIFTSANAVKAVFSKIESTPNWTFYCISGKTMEELVKYVPSSTILDTAENGALLAEKIIAHNYIKECLFFCGDKRMNTMPTSLLNKGIQLTELVVYQTVLTPQKLKRSFDGILFFSPTAVNSFFSLNNVSEKTALFSIGETTTKALKEFSKNEIITSTFPSAKQLINLVKQHYFKNQLSD
ncbi:uroporphyrinogen-III synthase [Arachidicoccus soli]|uniref:Uroporphyrinogen-III synthase n=1 Tax=Arachidicoccus soli TaxID=2341117 RepID=A0A386HUV6_9BACT|nr:uroporphyrinogen-III synthase [Arachidicoccus soli]AYD49194.1 uroporphyrinogen-III synthase [Arachidicoccus soli]